MNFKEVSAKQAAAANQNTKERDYWHKKLSGEPTRTRLPYDYRKRYQDPLFPVVARYEKLDLKLPEELAQKLLKISNNIDQTLHVILMAGLVVLLHRYNYAGNNDILVGTPIYKQEVEGEFINTVLVLRNILENNTTFKQLLMQIRQNVKEAVEHQDYPMTVLAEQLNMPAEGGFPLFEVALLLENIHEKSYIIDKVPYILFSFLKSGGEITGVLEYDPRLYLRTTIERIPPHFTLILEQVLRQLDTPVAGIDILLEEEQKKLLFEFNNTVRPYPADKTIPQLFEEQVARRGGNLAVDGIAHSAIHMETNVKTKPHTLTYKQLDDKTHRLAHLMQKKGLRPGTPVGIMTDPSVHTIVGLMAIFKAGGAYLPIDPQFPAARVRNMLADSAAAFLLSDKQEAFELLPRVKIIVTPPAPHIKRFDALPMPDRTHIDHRHYKNKIGMASVTNSISLQATRGCPYKCIYCHKVWSKNHVFRSAEKIFEEVLFYYEKGVRDFTFIDDCFNLNIDNSTRFFELVLRNKLDIEIFFPNGLRGDIMTPDYIDLMAEAGCRGVNLSLETASPRLQKLLKKNLDIDKFKKIIDYIAEKHPEIVLEIATMHGFPTETEKEATMTLDFIRSVKWLHFPYIHILKIYPNTEMEELALEHGISKEGILRSKDQAFHELPETLPFPKSFTRQYQSDFMNNYFLNRERLRHVLPVQTRVLSEKALVEKYNAYLPVDIGRTEDILEFTGIDDIQLPHKEELPLGAVPQLFEAPYTQPAPQPGAKRILLLDMTRHFSTHSMLYNVSEQPLGLLYLLTYIKHRFGAEIDGRIYKSGDDFDNFDELKELVEEYKPDLVGIRALTFYKEFFHETVSLLRQWDVDVPIIAGGPYAASDYETILKDKNIELVVLGEGEYVLAQLLEEMLKNGFKIPPGNVLETINGIAFVDRKTRTAQSCEMIFIEDDEESEDKIVIVEAEEEDGENNNTHQIKAIAPKKSGISNIAYVLYTSGTTGRPKGVLVEHSQILNCIFWMQDVFKLKPHHRVVQRTPLTFDPSVWEIFWPLVTGASTHVLPDRTRKDAAQLIDMLIDNRDLTVMYCTATLVTAIAAYLKTNPPEGKLKLPYFLTGAEPIAMETVKAIYSHLEGEFVNTYGPTEGTINNTWYPFPREEKRTIVPIGKPVANNRIHIMSKDLELMPRGVVGEICIAGDSIARGYLNCPELTAGAFMDDTPLSRRFPEIFAKTFAGTGNTKKTYLRLPEAKTTLYRTGDLGRWLPDGNIEILGRKDHQLKVRGYRIEPGEIENILAHCADVDQCLVLASDGTQWDEKIKECKQCGITNVYSHVTIQPNGDCNFCTDFERYKEDLQRYFKTREELAELIREKNAEKTSQYDCLIVYNGGRGAAYALYRLKELGFNVLAITFDNGYFSPKDLINIKRLTTSLGVDHDVLTHPRVDPIFKKSLEKAHTVCRGCYHISGSLAVEYANKHNINVTVGASLSKGQIIENNLLPYLGMGITDPAELEKNVDQIAQKSREVDKSIFDLIGISEISDGNAFKNVTSVNFYRYCEITNIELIAYLEEDGPYARLELPAVGKISAMTQGEYWKTRYKHAIYSTNCAIKQLGDYGVLREEGHHYYGAATAWERRLGHITRENFENDLSNIITEPQHDRFLQHFGVEAGPGTLQGNKELFVAAYIITRSGTLDLLKLREEMAKKLPAYMIPSYFVLIDKIPLTLNGKIDQQALPDPRKSIIRETFVPPSEGIQQTLAETWADILGVDKIGIDDNFFQAGGDSIKAIQVSARLVPQRLKLEIRDLFDNPTIRQLENYVKTVANLDLPEAEQGTIKGDVAISPIQHWYFENFPETLRHHVNQAVMLYKKDGFDKENLKTLLDEIIEHHDALRMIFVNDQNTPLGIRQVDRDLEESPLNLEVRDFTRGTPGVADRVKPGVAGRDKLVVSEPGKPAEPPEIVGIVGTVTPELDRETIKKIETETERIQGSINLAKGPLVKIVLFKTDHGDHLLIVIHHLVIDGVSWLILLEDLVTGYSQLGISGTVQLPEKTNSFQRWTEKLTEYAQSRELLDQLPYWKDVEETEVRSLPNDIEEIAKITGTSQETGTPQGSTNIRKRIYQETVTLNLNEKETHLLLTEANRPYNTEINDILVTVLADAFRDWGGMERITISMEGHGRESVIPGMTIARTVGWFTSIYPVILDVNQAREISRAIKDVKEHLRQIPNKGIGYGILRYLTPAELKKGVNFRIEPEINFNYLGQYRETGEGTIRLSNLSTGTSLNPELEHLFAIDINGMISGGCLTLSFAYSHREFKKDNIEKLVQIYKNTLLQVITHCAEKKTTELTPSDLDLPGITIHELEALEASFAKENKYIRDIYPLSPMQEGMLFHSRIDETAGTPVYFEQLTLTIAGDPDLNVMARTFNRLIEKYEVLRTVFVYETTHRPAQVLLKKKAAVMHVEDISHLSTGGVGAYLEQFKREDREMGFDLTVGPLMRVAMFITGQQRYTIVWSFHHILMDGWCFSILFGDFVNIYRTLKRGELPLQEQAIPYKRFIKWLQKQDKEEGLSYWTNYLDGYQQPAGVPKQALPQQTKALDKALKQEQARVKIDGALLGDYTRREDGIQVTLNTLFQTYWGIMLQRYNNTGDVVFGIVVSGRPPEIEGIEDMVGLFINTVPVRVKCKNQTFPELLEEVQKHSVDVRSYDYLPLAEIQACSSLKNKLIDHILVFENFPIKQNLQRAVSGSSSFQVLDMDMFEQTNYDFDILVSPGQEDPEVQITYNSDVYDSDFVYTVLAHMKNTIRQAANPNIKIRDICIITEEEKQQIMYDFNDTQEKLPAAKTIHDMFQQQVEKTPHNISITARDKKQTHHRHQITYLQLNRQANHLAAELQKKGVTYGTIAAIKVQRSIEMIVGLLAILKTNAAYLPIDTTTPPGRKRYIMADSNATFLLTEHNENENNTRPHLTPYEVIDIDEAMAKSHLKEKNCKLQTTQATNYKQNTKRKEEKLQTNAANMQQPETGFNPDEPNVHPSVGTPYPSTGTQLAYVIYTSGTTGKPKGVMVEHRSVINVLSWFGRHYLRFERTHVLQMTEYTFDPSIEEIFGTLLHGAVLHSVWNPLDVNLDTLRDYIRKHVIDILNFVPGLLKELLKDFKKPAGAGIIICGGERLEETVQEMIIKNGYELYNHYGPTEATIDVLTSRCLEGNMVTLGKPVDNTRVYILSSGLSVHMQPIGIPGELCVSGTGVARGYLNNPELTARRFIKEEKTRITGIEKENIGKSFAELFSNTHIVTPTPGGETGHRPEAAKYLTLYKTGDRARWLPDGRIEYFGRIDQQVKIRGHRVELAEIEHRMAAHPQIIEAVVLPYEQRKGEFYLCAYYIVDSPAETETTFSPPLREHLAAGLPGYMIPTHYVKMEKIPLTSTGKIDRNALPKPKAGAGVRYVEPRNNIDKKIIHIWSGILAIEPEEIGIDADFFELGGHSINATVLVAHIEQEFKIRYPLTAIFKIPFIRAIADTIAAELERKAAAAKPFEKNLVLLREGDKEHEHIFFIHTGSGGVSGYSAFCDRLPGKFNCWGIKADPLENLSPQQLSVEQLASRYLLKIKTIQPGGPYRIVGWCVGGTVAFEMARQLEWHCEEVKTLAIINSMAPHKELLPHGKLLTRQYQLEAIGRYMPGGKMRRELLAALADREVSEIWPEVIRRLTDTPEEEIFIGKLLEELPKGLGSPLPKYEKKNILNIIYAINVFIGLGTSRNRYLPSGKVAAQLQSYRSEKSPKSQTQHWDDYTKAPVNRYVIKGETLKILDPPNVENIAAKFATSLKEKRR